MSRWWHALLMSVTLAACDGAAQEPAGPTGQAADRDHDGVTPAEGDCDDGIESVHPGAREICNARDDDCDGRIDEVCDIDADYYTPEGGDCDDGEAMVNPGAFEYPANGADDDCDGLIDEAIVPCDGVHGVDSARGLAAGLELCDPWLIRATLSGAAAARAVSPRFGAFHPKTGRSLVVLSTGVAAAAGDPAFVEPQPGTEFGTDHDNPLPMLGRSNVCGALSHDPSTVYDAVELVLTIKVPTNARSFSFQFNFLTSEYPEWVGSPYNDKLIVKLESASFTGNISFDQRRHPITVNVGFFAICDSGPICNGMRDHVCEHPARQLTGTGFELDDGSGTAMGGATGWLTTRAPVKPGETATLRFILFDEGDHMLDSTVLIDDFQFQLAPAAAPTTVPQLD